MSEVPETIEGWTVTKMAPDIGEPYLWRLEAFDPVGTLLQRHGFHSLPLARSWALKHPAPTKASNSLPAPHIVHSVLGVMTLLEGFPGMSLLPYQDQRLILGELYMAGHAISVRKDRNGWRHIRIDGREMNVQQAMAHAEKWIQAKKEADNMATKMDTDARERGKEDARKARAAAGKPVKKPAAAVAQAADAKPRAAPPAAAPAASAAAARIGKTVATDTAGLPTTRPNGPVVRPMTGPKVPGGRKADSTKNQWANPAKAARLNSGFIARALFPKDQSGSDHRNKVLDVLTPHVLKHGKDAVKAKLKGQTFATVADLAKFLK